MGLWTNVSRVRANVENAPPQWRAAPFCLVARAPLVLTDDVLLSLDLHTFRSVAAPVSEPARRTTRPPALDDRFPVPLRGVRVDPATRCRHYDGPTDVIAIRFACCDVYYPCFRCHRAVADHDPARWPRARRHEAAVLCGACRRTMSAARYQASGPTCPHCGAAFNPGCAAHHDRYFA